jgi:hypothetical protein
MPRTLAALLLLLAAACAAPPEACRDRALSGLRALDAEIEATEQALALGYREAPGGEVRAGLRLCAEDGPLTLCLSGDRPLGAGTRPIDPAAERARLATLRSERRDAAAAAERALAACTAA